MRIRISLMTVVAIALVMATVVVLAVIAMRPARAEFCYKKIDSNVERLSGYRWSWRTVDGKKCWYYARHILPREDLVWSFTEEEFNADIERVIERKFYKPDQLIEAD